MSTGDLPRVGPRVRFTLRALLGASAIAMSAQACDAVIGLGAEPFDGTSVAGAGGAGPGTSSQSVLASTAEGVTTSSSVASGEGGAGGEATVATAVSTGGGGDPDAPCGACDPDNGDGDCGLDGYCDPNRGVCTIRTKSFEALALGTGYARGLAVVRDRAALIAGPAPSGGDKAWYLFIAPLTTQDEGYKLPVPGLGGAVAGSDASIVYMSFGEEVTTPSELVRFDCPVDPSAPCGEHPFPRVSWELDYAYGSLGWAGPANPGLFVASRRTDFGFDTFSVDDEAAPPCSLSDGASCHAPMKVTHTEEGLAWTEVPACGPEPGAVGYRALAVDADDACRTVMVPTPHEEAYDFTIGIAHTSGTTAFTGCTEAVGCGGYVKVGGSEPTAMVLEGGGRALATANPGIAVRGDGHVLMSGFFRDKDDADHYVLWECRPVGGEPYVCREYELPDGSRFDKPVYEIVSEGARLVVVETDGVDAHTIFCIDEGG